MPPTTVIRAAPKAEAIIATSRPIGPSPKTTTSSRGETPARRTPLKATAAGSTMAAHSTGTDGEIWCRKSAGNVISSAKPPFRLRMPVSVRRAQR